MELHCRTILVIKRPFSVRPYVFFFASEQRFEFAESLKRLISTWRLVFLITNEKASSLQRQEDRNARGATPVTFFSPREQKGREGSRIEGDDLRPDSRGMASALYVSIKQAEGGCLPHHMGSQSLFGTHTQFPPLGAYQSPPTGAYQSPPTGAYQIPPAGCVPTTTIVSC